MRVPGRRTWFFRLAFLALWTTSLALSACESSDAGGGGGPAGTGETATAAIGPAGGSLSVGGVTLTVPPGALAEERTLSATSTTEDPAGDFQRHSPVYRFEPAGTTFAAPVAVTMAFEGDPTAPTLWWTDESGAFASVGGTVENGRVVATVSHFSAGFVGTPEAPAGGADAGGGGDGGQPPAGDGLPEDIVRACTWVTGCATGPYIGSAPAACLQMMLRWRLGSVLDAQAAQMVERMMGCAETATDCTGFNACVTLGYGCADRTRCEGTVAIECQHPYDTGPEVFDCADFGLACEAGQCVLPGDRACTGWDGQCRGPVGLGCFDGQLEVMTVCAAGNECVLDPMGGTGCRPVDAACATPGERRCDGDVFIACDEQYELRADCGAVGLACDAAAFPPSATFCAPTGPGCREGLEEGGSLCLDPDVVACVGGHEIVVHCPDFEKSGCTNPANFPHCY